MSDTVYMKQAFDLAVRAAQLGEVPVGAVMVKDGQVIATAHNERELIPDATAHAEVLAIRRACAALGTNRLSGCTLYVTLEPCPMCAGALVNARVDRVVFGAYDARGGACGSLLRIQKYPLYHMPEFAGGVMEEECSTLLTEFFKQKR
ncbi:MAG: tRNA adenosine(34) deaminase TadA [Clostridia bacterium]|nr:tRNA adenosine(34) deaminase TadA [Clostridia bacterium]